MVKKYSILSSHFTFFKEINSADNNYFWLNECDNKNDGNNPYNENNNFPSKENDDKKHKYIKVLVDDPYGNRDIILKVTKKQKGIYI